MSLGISQTFLPFACLVFGIGLAMSFTLLERAKPSDPDEKQMLERRRNSLKCQLLEQTDQMSLEELEALTSSLL